MSMTENERILDNLKATLCDMVEIIDFETKRDKQDVKELDNDVSKIIDLLDELEEYRAIGTVEGLINEHKELIELSRRYLIDTNELLEYQVIGTVEDIEKSMQNVSVLLAEHELLKLYQAIGTVEELQEAKMQYDDIHSVAEKTALIGLSDYGTAKEAVITEIKRSLDYSLKEYQSIGTVEEFKDLKEKSVTNKPIRNDLCTCPSCGTHNEIIKKRRNTVLFDTVYCWHCGQAIEIKRD